MPMSSKSTPSRVSGKQQRVQYRRFSRKFVVESSSLRIVKVVSKRDRGFKRLSINSLPQRTRFRTILGPTGTRPIGAPTPIVISVS